MKCDTRTMVKTAIGLGLLGIIGYFALPQFRSFILGVSPVLLALVCPLSMIIMMKAMNSHQKEHERERVSNSRSTDVDETREQIARDGQTS